MRVVFISIFIITISNALAFDVTLKKGVNLTGCKANGDETAFHCVGKDKKDYLIYDHNKGYSAVQVGSDKIKSFQVEGIYDGFHTLYELSQLNPNRVTFREGPFIDYSTASQPLLIDYFKDDLNKIQNNEFKDLENRISKIIKNQQIKFDKSYNSNSLKIQLKSGENKVCQRQPTNRSCPLMSCGKDSKGNDLYLYKNTSFEDSSMNLFSFKNGRITKDASQVNSIHDSRGNFLEASIEEKGSFTRSSDVPSFYKNSPDTYEYLTDPIITPHMFRQIKSCGKEIYKSFYEEMLLAAKRNDNRNMVQLIDYANENIKSYYVNQDSVDNRCSHNGRYYSLKAYKELKETVPVEKKTITMDEAKELFSIGKNLPNMAWHVVENGCYARSHLMAKEFEKRGIEVQKAWLTGKLKIPGGNSNNWNYHTAPLVLVKDKDGNELQMIIDPSITSGPIPLKDWMAKVGATNVKKVGYPSPLNSDTYAGHTLSISNSTPYLRVYSSDMSEQQKIDDAKNTLIDYERARFDW